MPSPITIDRAPPVVVQETSLTNEHNNVNVEAEVNNDAELEVLG